MFAEGMTQNEEPDLIFVTIATIEIAMFIIIVSEIMKSDLQI